MITSMTLELYELSMLELYGSTSTYFERYNNHWIDKNTKVHKSHKGCATSATTSARRVISVAPLATGLIIPTLLTNPFGYNSTASNVLLQSLS